MLMLATPVGHLFKIYSNLLEDNDLCAPAYNNMNHYSFEILMIRTLPVPVSTAHVAYNDHCPAQS